MSFFVIFYDFVMKCVYKSTIHTFVIRDKIWTPPFVVQKCTCYFCVLAPENTPPRPPPPYMSGTFVLAPPPARVRVVVRVMNSLGVRVRVVVRVVVSVVDNFGVIVRVRT